MLVNEKDAESINVTIHNARDNFKDRQILLFGCTLFSSTIEKALNDSGYKTNAFIDNSKNKIGTKCMGINVYAPAEFLKSGIEKCFIIICSKYHNEMKKQLLDLGCTEEQILDIPVSESIGIVSDNEDSFEKSVVDVKKGYELYKKIYEEGRKVFLCPYPGTGDVYMACAHLQSFVEAINCKNYILVVTKNKCEKVASLFMDAPVLTISQNDSDLILKAWEFLGNNVVDLKPLLYWGWRTKRFLHSDRYPQITFYENYCFDVFGFKNRPILSTPKRINGGEDLKKCIKSNKLIEGKSVIIAPYAGSYDSSIHNEEWEKLVKYIKMLGYEVYTNCADNEKPIKGTIPIFFSYEIAIPLLEYAGVFISVRSGLCEVVSSADCKQIVIYENGFEASSINYFSIGKMGLNQNCIELVVDSDGKWIDSVAKKLRDN